MDIPERVYIELTVDLVTLTVMPEPSFTWSVKPEPGRQPALSLKSVEGSMWGVPLGIVKPQFQYFVVFPPPGQETVADELEVAMVAEVGDR